MKASDYMKMSLQRASQTNHQNKLLQYMHQRETMNDYWNGGQVRHTYAIMKRQRYGL